MRKLALLLREISGTVVDFLACSLQQEAPVIVFVSKMFPVDVRSLPQNRTRYFLYIYWCQNVCRRTSRAVSNCIHRKMDF